MKIAIIGTAGRGLDGRVLTLNTWCDMYDKLQDIIDDIRDRNRLDPTASFGLVSGGSAWADHLAVRFFMDMPMEFTSLDLYLPCAFAVNRNMFYDTGERNFRSNPGGTVNYYHRRFSEHLGTSSLQELAAVLQKGPAQGCRAHVNEQGLFARNTDVARNSDAIVAFTYGNGPVLKPGGTADTMQKFLQFHPDTRTAYHVDLNTKKAWRNPQIQPAAAGREAKA